VLQREQREQLAAQEREEHERVAAQERESRMRQDLLDLADQRAHAAALETQLEALRAAAATPPVSKVMDSSAPTQQAPTPASQLVDAPVLTQPISVPMTTDGLDTLFSSAPACNAPILTPQPMQIFAPARSALQRSADITACTVVQAVI